MIKLIVLLVAVACAVTAPPASAHISSIVTAPGRDFLATDQPVALRLKMEFNLANHADYTFQAYVWPSGNGPTLELVPLEAMYPGASQYQRGTINATDQTRWATRPGTYWIGVLATPKPSPTPTPTPCPPLPTPPLPAATSSAPIACPLAGRVPAPVAQMEGIPRSKVTVHAPLTLMWARFVARQKAERIGWRSKAPLTCVAPFAPSAYSCTFRWHVGRARRLVERAVTVAQDTTTGLVTVTRA